MHRREFLDPRLAAQAAGRVLAAADTLHVPDTPETSTGEFTLVRYARKAMGALFEIVLPFGHCVPLQAINDALDLIDRLESQLTVYHQESEVSAVNRRAHQEEMILEENLFNLLQRATSICTETQGAFDIATGALVNAWGYVKGPRRVPSKEDRLSALASSGSIHLALNAARKSVRYLVPGLELNLGSIGKGFALDCAGAMLQDSAKINAVLLHGGKSSVLGLGAPNGEPRGWAVGLEHPWDPSAQLASVYLNNRAMATSAATFKHLVHEGKKFGHILDPRTGWPAEGIASATAIADTAELADALSTAFFVMGCEQTDTYCQRHPHVGAILLREGASAPEIFNLSPSEAEPRT